MAILGSLFLVNGQTEAVGITMKQYTKLSHWENVEQKITQLLTSRKASWVIRPFRCPRVLLHWVVNFLCSAAVPVGSSGTSSTVSMRRPLVVPDGVVSSEVGLGTVRWCNSYFTIIYLAASYVSIYLCIYPSIHPSICLTITCTATPSNSPPWGFDHCVGSYRLTTGTLLKIGDFFWLCYK